MKKFINPIQFILFAVVLRLVPHIPNVAPIAAMALFGGAYLNKKYALVAPLVAMFFSDTFLGFSASTPIVYFSFLLTGLIGLWLRNHQHVMTVIYASLTSSLIFFVLTNFNYWFVASLYPKTMEGLLQSYMNALPFFRNTITGDLLYTGVLFGSYELVLRYHKRYVTLHTKNIL